MKIAVLCVAFLVGQEPAHTLQETLAWLANYMIAHGFLYENDSIVQVTRLHPIKGCAVELEREYPRAKGKTSIKRQIISFNLTDFDPSIHVQRTGEPSFMVTIARSDGRENVESTDETNDGTKIKTNRPEVNIFIDSDESANRLAIGLSHAIELCGGKRATF
jgi:hypothetical protein